ncbi:MAM and LDL-receptor class A domain-containing protein 2-like [Sycon ciliatum]|uniref:MAM and LDL-receptor class A domain-containing protein 2-like n=1 Tax=Sycon ciliatum TaxID=27933 RepID=UPI0031F62802|eukprot:scpid38672/ scgid34366/ Thyroid hormone-induced protein B
MATSWCHDTLLPAVTLLISLLVAERAGGQEGREGLVQCLPGLQPAHGTGIGPGWQQPQSPCWTIEDGLLRWNSSQPEVDNADAGDTLLFTGTGGSTCLLRSVQLHLAQTKDQCHLQFGVRMWGGRPKNSLALSLLVNPVVGDADSSDSQVWMNSSSSQHQDSSRWGTVTVALSSASLQLSQLEFAANVGLPSQEAGVALSSVTWTDCCMTECKRNIGFDGGWDGWYNAFPKQAKDSVGGPSFKWQRWQGSTPSQQTGPDGDLTSVDGKGYYLYIDASYGAAGDQATLLSPILTRKTQALSCKVSFGFHIFGQDVGYLLVGVRANDDWNKTIVLGNISTSASGWRQSGNLDIPQHVTQFRVVFTGVRGNGFQGDIAVDRIILDEWCSCPQRQDPLALDTGSTPRDGPESTPSSSASNEGYIAAVTILCIVCAALIVYILVRQYILPRQQTQPPALPEEMKENPVFITTQKRHSLLGLPVNENLSQLPMRRSSSTSWQVRSPEGVDQGADTDDRATTGGTEHIDITPSLLDLMEMESTDGGVLA